MKRYSLIFVLLVGLNAFTGFLQAMQPLVIAPAINVIMGDSSPPSPSFSEITLNNLGPTIIDWIGITVSGLRDVVGVVAVSYLSLTTLIVLLGTCAFWMSAHVRGRVLTDMLVSLHSHIISLPISFFSTKREGDLISRFTVDTTATVNLLDGLLRGLFQSLVQVSIYLYFLIHTDPLLAFATFGIGGLHMLITRLLSGWVRRRTKAFYDFYGRLTAALQESIQNVRVTKSFASEKYDHARFADETLSVERNLFRFRIARYTEEPIRLLADALSIVLMMLLAYYAMEQGRLTAVGFAMFVFLAGRAVAPISGFSKHFLSIFVVAGSAARVLEVFSIPNLMKDGNRQAAPLNRCIRFQDVYFAYDQKERDVLKGINLEIKQGEMTAIVGQSGSGKSTLCDLILRLHDPSAGQVLYDGQDIRKFKKASYLQRFGMVPQETLLLNASVRDNILYGRPMDREQFDHAIMIANAEEFIQHLSKGEATEIGDRGVRLSGGQRQRLAIARAIYGNPSILVLDEATSSLDSESERLVQKAIDSVIKNMTSIVIAHRLSTVMHAGRIVVFKAGKVEAIGKHHELLEQSMTYQRLYELQFRKV